MPKATKSAANKAAAKDKTATAAAPRGRAASAAAPAPARNGVTFHERRFYSRIGDPIRVTHANGAIAIVGADPRALPPSLHRSAIKAGCQVLEAGEPYFGKGAMPAIVPDEDPSIDQFTRMQAIKDAILEALDSDSDDPAYADAFTGQDIPSVEWLTAKVGFTVSATERDQAWAEVQNEIPADDDDADGTDDDADEGNQDETAE
jgi:hypothetical protein